MSLVLVLLTCTLYLRGLRAASRWRVASFLASMAALGVSLSPPVDGLADGSLAAHMTQHLVLLILVPILAVLGEPVAPILRGIPRRARRSLARLLTAHGFVGLLRAGWSGTLVLAVALVGWHVPVLYDLALANEPIHYLEHACFLGAALLFWAQILGMRPLIVPPPTGPALIALFFASLENTAIGALLALANEVVYPHYLRGLGLGGLSPLDDQRVAGAIMWIPGGGAFLLAILFVIARELYGESSSLRGEATIADRQRGPMVNARGN